MTSESRTNNPAAFSLFQRKELFRKAGDLGSQAALLNFPMAGVDIGPRAFHERGYLCVGRVGLCLFGIDLCLDILLNQVELCDQLRVLAH